jgi:hypothetical protein
VQGKSKSKIALDYGVPTHSLDYHKEHHVSRQMAQHMDRKEAIDAVGLMDELQEIVADTKSIFKRNSLKDSVAGDSVALKALDSRRATFDTILKACQLYHEAKLLELENSQDRFEQERKARTQEQIKRLTTEELEAMLYLERRLAGEEIPDADVPGIFKAAAPPTPAPRPSLPPPLPRPKLPPTTESEPAYAVEDPEPGPDQGEPESEVEKPKGLPPAPTREIPGGGRALKLRRHLLGKKVLDGLGE